MPASLEHKKSRPKKNEYGMWQVDVDGLPFEFEQWGAEESTDILLDMTSMVGEPLSAAAAAMQTGGGMSTQITPDLAATVVRALMANVRQDKERVMEILQKLTAKGVTCKGARVDFDSFYKGKLGLMLKAARAGFEVQYGNFSDAVLTPLGFTAKGKTAASTQKD